MGIKKLSGVVLLILLLLQACRPATQSKITPSPGNINTFPIIANPLSSPMPVDQASALLPGLPPIPQGITHYILRIDIDYAGRAFKGYSRVDYTNNESVFLDRLFFRLYPNMGQSYGDGRINITSAYVNGEQAEYKLSSFNSVVEIELPDPLGPGGQVQLDFETKGMVPVDFGGGDLKAGYGIFNYSQGVLALANFYPILAVYEDGSWRLDPIYAIGDSVYSDAALYTVEILTDPGTNVATSGMWISQQDVGGKELQRFISGPARDFFIIASPDYQVASKEVSGTTVNSYYLPEHAKGGAQALEVAADSLGIFNSLFGPYPYKEYDVVEAPLNRASGVEYPGMGLITSRLYDNLTKPDFDSTVVHEVAHQWWYNVVGNDVIRAPWMDEALATYSSILYWEQVGGHSAREQALAYYQDRFNENTQNGLDAPVTEPLAYFRESDRAQSYGPVVYAKGALAFENLRQTIGDESFFKAIQFYYGTHWFSIANTGELLAAFQMATDIQLDSFYQTRLYLPELSTPTSTPTQEPTPTATSTATPEPTQTHTPEPTPTPMPSPIVFAAIGDYGGGNSGAQEIANLIKSWQPEFIITLGDNNYPIGARDHIDVAIGQFFHEFIYPYQGNYGAGADINRFFPTIGNHDMQSEFGQPYFDYFTLPGNERYYDFVWGPIHFYALNSLDSEPDGVGASSIQAEWLRKSLADSDSPWNIVFCHYAPYSSGQYGPIDWMQWPYDEWGVDAVLSGHDHIYERLFVDGVHYFVNGMGGYDLYEFHDILEASLARYIGDYGAMRMEATEQYLLFQFIDRNYVLIDEVKLGR